MAVFLRKIAARKWRIILIIGIIFGGGYFAYTKFSPKTVPVRYVLGEVKRGTIIAAISGSGQVSSSNQVDIKSKSVGDVSLIKTANGKKVQAGELLAQLDDRDSRKAVSDAEMNLESAQIALEKLQNAKEDAEKSARDAEVSLESAEIALKKLREPADALELLQAENALTEAKESRSEAESDLKKKYGDGFNDVSNVFLDLPGIMSGMEDMFYKNTISGQTNNIDWYESQIAIWEPTVAEYRAGFLKSYLQAREKYLAVSDAYRKASRTSAEEDIEKLISQTYGTTRDIADAVKKAHNYIGFVKEILQRRNINIPSLVGTHQTSLDTYTTETNSHINTLSSSSQAITDGKQSLVKAERAVEEKAQALKKLKAGADELDIRAAEITVLQRKNSLADAREKLAEYDDSTDLRSARLTVRQRESSLSDARARLADLSIRSTLNGTVAKIDLKKGDSVNSGATIATVISQQKIAEVSLNEVDVSGVKISQKVSLTFDAVQDLTITGTVAEIDAIGTASQGVVTYTVKINLDGDDPRVKPGMSVTGNIILEVKTDVLTVPNSAVKTQGDENYVEIIAEMAAGQTAVNSETGQNGGVTSNFAPQRKTVAVGLSNDESTEIISGLEEGERIIVRTVQENGASSAANRQQTPLFRIPGAGGGGGGNTRRTGF